ncbi:hypothetical protein [Blautia sp. AM47-4]|jgi:hypothetical protein|uniref:hypothetical protein n=1 Tax=Blautia sp. AM47-4 TaxID=2292979 RepID=UPI001FA9BB00|nr:hypothetical protein [Blautia sp. AM47-4]
MARRKSYCGKMVATAESFVFSWESAVSFEDPAQPVRRRRAGRRRRRNVFFEKNVMILLSERKHGGIRKSSVSDCFVTNAAGVGSGRREQMSPKKDQLSSYSREDSFVKERKTSYRKEGKKLPFPVKKKGSFEKIS